MNWPLVFSFWLLVRHYLVKNGHKTYFLKFYSIIKQINKKESITQIIKSGDDISKFINYKPKYLDLKKILKTNIKWFRKIY